MKLSILIILLLSAYGFTAESQTINQNEIQTTGKDQKGHIELTDFERIGYDPESLHVNPERYHKFVAGLHKTKVAVVSVNGMVCDFCARGIAKTFKKDKSVQKIDVDLQAGKVLIAYGDSKDINFQDIQDKILANGQNAMDYIVLEF